MSTTDGLQQLREAACRLKHKRHHYQLLINMWIRMECRYCGHQQGVSELVRQQLDKAYYTPSPLLNHLRKRS